jgi:hypothetical protein
MKPPGFVLAWRVWWAGQHWRREGCAECLNWLVWGTR